MGLRLLSSMPLPALSLRRSASPIDAAHSSGIAVRKGPPLWGRLRRGLTTRTLTAVDPCAGWHSSRQGRPCRASDHEQRWETRCMHGH
jgi:hypothetical protein